MKRIIGIVAVVVIVGGFIGSTFVINSINKNMFNEHTPKLKDAISYFVANVILAEQESVNLLGEQENLDSNAKLAEIEAFVKENLEITFSEYKSGFLRSNASAEVFVKNIDESNPIINADVQFSNLFFGDNVKITLKNSYIKEGYEKMQQDENTDIKASGFSDGSFAIIKVGIDSAKVKVSASLADDVELITYETQENVRKKAGELIIKDLHLGIVLNHKKNFAFVSDFFEIKKLLVAFEDIDIDLQGLFTKDIYKNENLNLENILNKDNVNTDFSSQFKLSSLFIAFKELDTQKNTISNALAHRIKDLKAAGDSALKEGKLDSKFKLAFDYDIESNTDNFSSKIKDFDADIKLENLDIKALSNINPIEYMIFGAAAVLNHINDATLALENGAFKIDGKKVQFNTSYKQGDIAFSIFSKHSATELLDSFKNAQGFAQMLQAAKEHFVKNDGSDEYRFDFNFNTNQPLSVE